MEYISLQDFEENFDFILDDVQASKVHYQIELPNGNAVVLLPAEDYQFLKNTYDDWIK
jgi:PHD/YefM family antitoxin component YafN of YafNO toxin-antitoxin module